MGTSVKGESKKRKARRALSWLKSAAIVIAVLDLILAINDSRNVGRFFLLLSMSSTFSIVPENLLRDHCRESITGICQTYTQFATGKRLPSVKETILKRRAYFDASKEETSSSPFAKPFYPDYLSELVLSWKSMFDQSRAEANVSFYYDDSQRGSGSSSSKGMREMGAQQHSPSSSRPTSSSSSLSRSSLGRPTRPNSGGTGTQGDRSNLKKSSTDLGRADDVGSAVRGSHLSSDGGSQSITTVTTGGGSKSGGMGGIHSYSIASDHTFLRMGRRKRDVLVENAETGRREAPFLISEQELNANGAAAGGGGGGGGSSVDREFRRLSSSSPSQLLSTSPSSSSSSSPPSQSPALNPTQPSTPEKIDKGTTKETPTPTLSHASSTVFISDDLTTRGSPSSSQSSSSSSSSSLNLKVAEEEEEERGRRKPLKVSLTRNPSTATDSSSSLLPKSKVSLESEKSHETRAAINIKLNSTRSSSSSSNSPSVSREEGKNKTQKKKKKFVDFGLISKGPKELLGYVEEEMFTRWPLLLETVQKLLEGKNMSSLQLVSPEATRIKMHIEVRPFGPDPFKDARKRLKATQQTLFDYPWLTIVQLYGRLSESFTIVFIGISVYTWVWGTAIALLLLIGSYREDQTTLHIWMVFNIIYTFLQFMIDNWIHTNIGPERSSVCLWLFNIYSVYKPLAAYIAITQLSEIEKARFDGEEDNYLSSSSSTTKLIPAPSRSCSRKSSVKGSSSSSPTASTRTGGSCVSIGGTCDQQHQHQHSSSSAMVSCTTTTKTTTTTATTSGNVLGVGTNSQLQEASLRLRESTIVDMANQSSLALPLSAMLRTSLENSFLQSLVVWTPSEEGGVGPIASEEDVQARLVDHSPHQHHSNHCSKDGEKCVEVDEEYEEEEEEEEEEEDSLDEDDDEDSDDEENKDQDDYEDNDEACDGDNRRCPKTLRGGDGDGESSRDLIGGGGGCSHHP